MAHHIRRQPRKLPSVRKHGLSAVLLLAIIILSTISWLNISAKNKPAAPTGKEVVLPKPIELEQVNEEPNLPDLLEPDNIPQDVNPTEQVDMVGGPNTRPKASTPPANSAPVIIDGRAIPVGSQTIRNYTPLTRAPIDGLSRMTPYGRIPHPHADGRTALDAYAKPFTPKAQTKYVALVVGGLGLNPSITRKAINNLPGTVTLSFAAEAPGLQGWINEARAHGHEVLIELPMQGSGPIETRTLVSGGSESANSKNLEYLLSRAQGYFAVTNYDGDHLVNNEAALLPLITIMKDAGLGFVYDGALADTRMAALAKREALPFIIANAYLDEQQHDSAYVSRNIKTLPDKSDDNIPIGMGFAYAGTIDGIKAWLATKPKNIKLAPVSYALKTR